jgi:parvulin-like peptidyl-prolyl isomerase
MDAISIPTLTELPLMRQQQMKRWPVLAGISFFLAACGPMATPEVIRDNSRSNTLTAIAQPSATPTGPTPTATMTSTPYVRATDVPDLPLDTPIVQVGDETITLGQFRARVRYERFAALDDVRRTVESIGLANLDFTLPANRQAADYVASVFNTLANSNAFGQQIYDVMVRESIIRQEFKKRQLTLNEREAQGYWVRRFALQRVEDPFTAVVPALDSYVEEAIRYSGLTRDEILTIANNFVMADTLNPVIVREVAQYPDALTYRLRRITAATAADADAALALLKAGATPQANFREAACKYSIDPAVRGLGGDRGELGFSAAPFAELYNAEVGAVVGPFQSPVGWQIFKVNGKRRNADGDTLVRAQGITVSGQPLAEDIIKRLGAGEDFATLACLHSLDSTGGNGGDFGTVEGRTLPTNLANALSGTDNNGLFGPIEADGKFEVALVESRDFKVLEPAEVDQINREAYVRWQRDRANSSYVQSFGDAWKTQIPADPLPRQVAPFLVEESFGLPTLVPTPIETPAAGETVTPTPQP